jgi:hypothetical protein
MSLAAEPQSFSAAGANIHIVAVTTARLTVGRNEAIKQIKAQLERGLEIKRAKIRYVPELEKAREAKGEWTTSTMDLLKRIFNSDAVADECQNWVGKVLPEYADLNLFIEHFYDEMDQRLRKLHAVLKQVQALPDDSGPKTLNPGAAMASATPAVAIAPASPVVQAAPMPSPVPAPAQEAINPRPQMNTASHGVAAYPSLTSERPAAAKRTGAVIVYDDDQSDQESLQQFVVKLGFECALVQDKPTKKGGGIAEKLDHLPRVDFGLILAKPDAMPKPFDLGYCVGKLGLKRIFVLTPDADKVFVDEYGLLHIPLDPADGWQLHLARQFKRVGLEVDLNRVF